MVFSNIAVTGAIVRTFKQAKPDRPQIIKASQLWVWSGGTAANKGPGKEDQCRIY
jgi:hypothetical protein